MISKSSLQRKPSFLLKQFSLRTQTKFPFENYQKDTIICLLLREWFSQLPNDHAKKC